MVSLRVGWHLLWLVSPAVGVLGLCGLHLKARPVCSGRPDVSHPERLEQAHVLRTQARCRAGKCEADWMVAPAPFEQGYCQISCGRCPCPEEWPGDEQDDTPNAGARPAAKQASAIVMPTGSAAEAGAGADTVQSGPQSAWSMRDAGVDTIAQTGGSMDDALPDSAPGTASPAQGLSAFSGVMSGWDAPAKGEQSPWQKLSPA